ncbi:MAG: hypothetical protein METHAR1v1_1550011 [Methanothrix sp.]|nr:MAG: hypothetical protein METHAR1v1_1550011 [Methanothrix sp.]
MARTKAARGSIKELYQSKLIKDTLGEVHIIILIS